MGNDDRLIGLAARLLHVQNREVLNVYKDTLNRDNAQ